MKMLQSHWVAAITAKCTSHIQTALCLRVLQLRLNKPHFGDEFLTKHEDSNPHDKYVITELPVDDKVTKMVDHLPREISKEWCLLILHVGNISRTVTGRMHKTV